MRFVATAPEDALDAADDAVEALLEEGWDPRNIALLTTGHRHPEQQAQTERHGQVGYWRSFWDGEDVFYGPRPRKQGPRARSRRPLRQRGG